LTFTAVTSQQKGKLEQAHVILYDKSNPKHDREYLLGAAKTADEVLQWRKKECKTSITMDVDEFKEEEEEEKSIRPS
jgi:hypothetical protein